MIRIEVLGEEGVVFNDVSRAVRKAIAELDIEATVIEVTDLEKIIQHKLAIMPAVFINGKLQCQGHAITVQFAKQCIQKSLHGLE